MQDYFLAERGIAYRTNTFTAGRRTIVFIHGLSGSASAWFPFEEQLTGEYNLVTYDLRGHGISKKYVRYEDYELKQFADDLSALLKHLEIEHCALVAHSMGTTIALLFLLKNSNVVDSALFLAPDYRVHSLLRTRMSNPFLVIGTALLRLIPFHPKTGHRLDYSNFGYSRDWSLKRIFPEIKDMSVRLYLFCLQHLYLFDHDDWWKKSTCP